MMTAKDAITAIRNNPDQSDAAAVWQAIEELATQIDGLRNGSPAIAARSLNDQLRGL